MTQASTPILPLRMLDKMSTPNYEGSVLQDEATTTDDTPTTVGILNPSSAWHGVVSAWLHVYDPSDHAVSADFELRGRAERDAEGNCTVYSSRILEKECHASLMTLSAAIASISIGNQSYIGIVGFGVAATNLRWYIQSKHLFGTV